MGVDGDNLVLAFQDAVGEAQSLLFHAAARRPDWRGMGTTLTLAYVFGNYLFIAHVGDSRCYLLRGGTLRRLTHDHSRAEEMISEDAAHRPHQRGRTRKPAVRRPASHGARPNKPPRRRRSLREWTTLAPLAPRCGSGASAPIGWPFKELGPGGRLKGPGVPGVPAREDARLFSGKSEK